MDILKEALTSRFPDETEQVKLVKESVLIFADSNNDKSMEKFYSYISVLWQQQSTVQQLDQVFTPFYELEVDLTSLEGNSPIFSTIPSLDENGVMLITGFYPTKPQQLYFKLKYLYEGLHWKLMGFNVNLKQEPFSFLGLPNETEQVKLVNESVLIFGESVNDKSMEKLYSYISVLWQQHCTVQQLDEAFSSIYELNEDLTVLKSHSPIFSNNPSIDENGTMLITGFYPTKPKQFHFALKYLSEGRSWKLRSINIDIN